LNNKQQKQSHAESSIESLKMLSQQHSDEHFLHLLKKVQSARRSLEVLYQTVSEKRRKLVGEKEVLEAQKTIANNDSKQPQEDKKPSTPRKRQEQKEFSRPNAAGAKKEYGQKPYQKQNSYKESGAASYNHAKPRPFSSSNTAPVVEEVETTTVRNKFANSNLNKKPSSNDYDKKAKTLNKKQLLKRNLIDDGRDGDRIITRKPKKKNKNAVVAPPKVIEHAVITTDNLTVKLLAEAIGKPVTEIVKKLFLLGVMATINSVIDFDIAELVAGELGITLEKKVEKTYEEKLTDLMETEQDDAKDLKPRAPIVTVMGHVDHGKTSLLDSIRQTNVISGEAGGITQNIGAYTVKTEKGKITFIDTPGHAAFTEMRARGAKVTDIAILVVAADDGIMPQTVEAINHIKAADVPMVVAINKIDKPHANVEKTKQQLAEHNVLAEDWGGDTIMVPVSAHTKEGLDTLLDMIVLVAEVKELKANPKRDGIGTVIEAKLDKGRGPVATIIVQNGTLKVGDSIVAGVSSGRIRAMVDDQGKEIKKATPSMPVAVIGFDSVPEAGSIANVVEDKMMKELVLERENKQKEERFTAKPMNLDDLFSKAKSGNLKTLNIIIKANVSGVMEALKQSLEKIKNEEVTVRCIHGAAGAINENDVLLAQTADAIIIGFNVRPDVNAKKLAEKNNIDIRYYSIIYNAIDDIEAAIKGMLAPKFEEVVIGHAEVRVLYKISKLGTIAGCMVKDGRITRASSIRVLRNNTVLADTSIDTLRIQKDDVKEVKSGFECGIKLAGFNDFKEGDVLEAYLNEQIKN
jgi:translation initiation factor IF-2